MTASVDTGLVGLIGGPGCPAQAPLTLEDFFKAKTKDTNPKDAIGIAKVPASTVPREVIAEVGLAMMEGALKYGRHNYREAGVRTSVYFDACTRHLDAFWEGQDIDPDSGLSHLVKAIACLVVLRDSQFRANWVDDRPPKLPDNWQSDLNAKAAALLEKYPDPLPAHVQATEKPAWTFKIPATVGDRPSLPNIAYTGVMSNVGSAHDEPATVTATLTPTQGGTA